VFRAKVFQNKIRLNVYRFYVDVKFMRYAARYTLLGHVFSAVQTKWLSNTTRIEDT